MEELGDAFAHLTEDQIRGFVHAQVKGWARPGASVCVVVPDATRVCPLPLLFDATLSALNAAGADRVAVVVALGTHARMSQQALAEHLGADPAQLAERTPTVTVINHEWAEPATFVELGMISEATVRRLADGRFGTDVPVRINRAVVEHDQVLIIGPVLPHEVVGFSGGNKYLFPGLSGPEMIDVSHWLGALITNAELIGVGGVTPVRALIDEAAAMLPTQVGALCVVTDSEGGLHSAAFGEAREAWASAAAVSAATHVRYVPQLFQTVLSLVPKRYDDLWTAAKGFYKVEPVVANGGRVILLAPHLTEIAPMHPGVERIGYHCRDYFLGQWDKFSAMPWGELAHSTHLRGAGTWDPIGGERWRVSVTLASGMSRERTLAVGLDWADPASIDVAAYAADGDCLVVPDAGEVLYRLADAPASPR